MKSIKCLGNEITNKIKNNNKLQDLDYILDSYSGFDWYDYIKINNDTYNRELVYNNDTISIFVLTWNNKQKSHIHDHPENGCLLKVLKGKLVECIYDKNLNLTNVDFLKKGSSSFKIGGDELHKIINIYDKLAISIHIYSPPNYIPKIYDNTIE